MGVGFGYAQPTELLKMELLNMELLSMELLNMELLNTELLNVEQGRNASFQQFWECHSLACCRISASSVSGILSRFFRMKLIRPWLLSF